MSENIKVKQIEVFGNHNSVDENQILANSLMLTLDPNDVISARCLGGENKAIEVVFLQETSEVDEAVREQAAVHADQIFGEQE